VSDPWESLSESGIPELRGARCRGKWSIFDETECPETTEYALNQCAMCECRPECVRWFESLKPSKRPVGVVAGRVVRQHTKAAA
jgi:WhiB family redox-sensing transcriptional regulator